MSKRKQQHIRDLIQKIWILFVQRIFMMHFSKPPYRGNLKSGGMSTEQCSMLTEQCTRAHSSDFEHILQIGLLLARDLTCGATYHSHYPSHRPQFGNFWVWQSTVFHHRTISFHSSFSAEYDPVSKLGRYGCLQAGLLFKLKLAERVLQLQCLSSGFPLWKDSGNRYNCKFGNNLMFFVR